MLLFGDDLPQLHRWRSAVIQRLAELRLTVHLGSAQPRPCTSGLPFLGFQLFPDHRRLKRQKVLSARQRLRQYLLEYRAGQRAQAQMHASIQGWINHARYADTWGLRRAILQEVVL